MDPFYFLDLDLDSDDDTDGVYEYCESSPSGDWIIECDKGSVIYKNNKYKRIHYDNNSRIITFTDVNNMITEQKLTLVTVDTDNSPELVRPDAYWRERGATIETIEHAMSDVQESRPRRERRHTSPI